MFIVNVNDFFVAEHATKFTIIFAKYVCCLLLAVTCVVVK